MVRFFKRHAWLLALIAFLLLFPQALSSQARLNNRVIITGLAIDKIQDGYEVTAQVVLPEPGSESGGEGARLDFISEQGSSIAEGMKKISFNIGEIAGLSHTNFILVGETMFEDNLVADMDYFLRDDHLPNAVMLLCCEGSAKEQIKKTGELELSVGIALQKVFIYKQGSLNSRMIALQDFADSAFGQSGVSVLPELKITNENDKQQDTSGGDATGSNGGSSSSSQSSTGGASSGTSSSSGSSSGASESANKQGRIEFFTPIAYFKNGRFVDKITAQEDIIGYLLTQNFTNTFDLVVENVNDGNVYKNAEVGLRIGKKTTTHKIDLSGAVPKYKIDIVFDKVKLMEVINEDVAYQGTYAVLTPYLNDALIDAVKSSIEGRVIELFEKTKAQNVDLFKIADRAYKFNKTDWQKFLKGLGDIDNYINKFEIEVNVSIKNFL